MNSEQGFLDAIRAAPADEVNRLVYADWLEEQGDPRARYLRMELELARMDEDDPRYAAREAELQLCRVPLEPLWVHEVGRAYDLFLLGYDSSRKIMVIKLLRELTAIGIAEAKGLAESLPVLVKPGISRAETEQLRDRFRKHVLVEMVIRLSSAFDRPANFFPHTVCHPSPSESGDIVLYDYPAANKLSLIRLMRGLTNLGLSETLKLIESPLPVTILRGVAPEQAKQVLPRFEPLCSASFQRVV